MGALSKILAFIFALLFVVFLILTIVYKGQADKFKKKIDKCKEGCNCLKDDEPKTTAGCVKGLNC